MELIPALKAAQDHLGIIAAIAGSIGLLIPKVRHAVAWLYRFLRQPLVRERKEMREDMDELLKMVRAIKQDLEFNGGNSIRDMVVVQVNRQRADFWRSLKPSFEMGKDADVQIVSESACHLFNVADPLELRSRNWMNFVCCGLDGFLTAYKNALEFNSSVNYPMDLQDFDNNPRGRWELRLTPITPGKSARPVYTGYLKPLCPLAKKVAEEIM